MMLIYMYIIFSEPYDQNPILVSTLNVVRGCSTPMDLVRVQTNSQASYIQSVSELAYYICYIGCFD